MAIKALFPTHILHEPLAPASTTRRLNRELARDTDALMDLDQTGWKWSEKNYAAGYTSYGSVADLHRRFAPFMELKRLIDRKARALTRSLEWDLQGGKLEMTTCWVNVMPTHSHHSLHLHPLSVLSGTYYVTVPKGAGSLKFEDPRLGLFMGAPPRKAGGRRETAPFYVLEPKAGDVALWESWLRHEVTANRSGDTRISVSFNYEWL